MLDLYQSERYLADVRRVAELELPWKCLQGKSVMLSGATGMLGSFLVDVLMERNRQGQEVTIYALGRNRERAEQRFAQNFEAKEFVFIPYDVKQPFTREDLGDMDYVLHLASNTHPQQYSTDPIGTITTNIMGLQNLLDFAVRHHACRFVFASSNEIYGENRGDVELFDEGYCGYIDCNTMRAGYTESKRCGEALCQAYWAQKGLDVVIPRFTRSYGPTMLPTDTKAISQFIRKCVADDDIVLKSAGTQYYSYQYTADSVSGLLTVLLKGKSGEAYNIADKHSDITLRELAEFLAGLNGKKVVFELPDAVEAAGYSKATKARLDGSKLAGLGWRPMYDIKMGLERTVEILREMNKEEKVVIEITHTEGC